MVRTCADCGRTGELGSRRHNDSVWHHTRCPACRLKRRRVRAAAVQRHDLYGEAHVERAPDRGPAILLRLELERLRAEGCTWSRAWTSALHTLLEQLPEQEARSWLDVFRSTASTWRLAYAGEPVGPGLFVPEPEGAVDGTFFSDGVHANRTLGGSQNRCGK